MKTPNPRNLLSLLEGAANKLGIEVRYEDLISRDDAGSSRGGLCRLHDFKIVLIHDQLGPEDRCDVLAGALARLDLSEIYLPPAIRAAIERAREQGL